ncbi:DUF3298 and DUF4163 domain-containing protein [Sandaracinobacter sp. RS1-74]|uniref:DUF3298 and DUF4163 domain-containing protein n=1 Tax=Sandaracinobacteroides sayramensis TaxID=2913411 RepID=UPI001ED9FB22|nr:DUF3298 and DUF4163 domain-containing protein [Sandaracinobacteroides sayramensis]MCG2841716.1 DUF3298 and DUF4163 domain-containing protein [Sandaracinobacteroides sayramensis]
MNRRSAFLVPLALLLAAPALAQNPGGARAGAPPATEPELPASDLLVRYESPALGFRWSLAPEAALEPRLVQDMRGEALAERGRQIRSADEAAAAAQPGDRKYQTEWSERWEPEAETDLLLAFSTRQYSYTGGAHGNVMFRTVIWDRDAGRRIQFAELFQDANGALAALKPAFCKALDAERKDRRGGVQLGGDYDKCPDFTAYPIVPQGEGEIGAIRVLVPPYEAGPWAEGVYEIALDAALVRPFLAPRYAGAFAKP